VTVPALALAAGDTSIVLVRAAAMISDTFLNEFIYFFLLFTCLLMSTGIHVVFLYHTM
jgi:hypothetical protein